jgi:hypothetical protein
MFSSLNPPPCQTFNRFLSGFVSNRKQSSKTRVTSAIEKPVRPHKPNNFHSKLRIVAPFTSNASSLISRVSAIFCMCPKPEMIWSNAGRVVSSGTVVANLHKFRYISHVKKPACSWGKHVSRPDPAAVHYAVSLAVQRTGPDPTRVGLGGLSDLCPKASRERGRKTFGLKELRGNLFSHIKLWLMCHAPCGDNRDGAFLFWPGTLKTQT